MPATVRCPACERSNGAKSRFCRFCGARMSVRPPAHRRAIDQFVRGDAAAAERLLRESVAAHPEDPEAHRHLGHVLLHASRRDEALAAYERARVLGDDSAELRFNLGVLLRDRGRVREAAAELEAAARGAAAVREGEFYLGLLFPEERRFRAECLLHLGSCRKELGDLPGAIGRLEESVSLHADGMFAHGALGDAYLAAGRLDDSVREYGRVLALAPPGSDLPNVHNDLGIAYYRQGRVPEAIRELTQVVTKHPDDANAIYNLGLIHAEEGLSKRVADDYRELARSPRAAEIFLAMSRSLFTLGKVHATRDGDEGLVGDSPAMQALREQIGRAAVSDSTLLIVGERGSGKEVVARAIHRASPRTDRPFVSVNCAAGPEGWFDRELFGQEKGALGGTTSRRAGHFEAADRGTIFLDEIGALTPSIQSKLLRVLQEKEVEHVGGMTPIAVDVRIVAATNRSLRQLVRDGRFRDDLLARLDVIQVDVPTLRARAADIADLVGHFLARDARRYHKRFREVSPDALDLLRSHAWPGNVRELEQVIEHAVAMHDGAVLGVEQLPVDLRGAGAAPLAGRAAWTLAEVERQTVSDALARNGGRKAVAARELGIDPSTLWRKMKLYRLQPARTLRDARKRT